MELSSASLVHWMRWSKNLGVITKKCLRVCAYISQLFTIALRRYVNMQFLAYRGLWHSCFVLKEKDGVTTATAIPLKQYLPM